MQHKYHRPATPNDKIESIAIQDGGMSSVVYVCVSVVGRSRTHTHTQFHTDAAAVAALCECVRGSLCVPLCVYARARVKISSLPHTHTRKAAVADERFTLSSRSLDSDRNRYGCDSDRIRLQPCVPPCVCVCVRSARTSGRVQRSAVSHAVRDRRLNR